MIVKIDERHFLISEVPFYDMHGLSYNQIPDQYKQSFFLVMKTVGMFEWYFNFFKNKNVSNILEAGIAFGGSLAAWALLFNSKKVVGIDISKPREEVDHKLKKYNLSHQIKTYWNTSQDNTQKVKEIIEKEFQNEWIDVIIDDGSHIFEPTLQFFQTTFPYLKPYGYYIIEDVGWANWPYYKNASLVTNNCHSLTELCFLLIMAYLSFNTKLFNNIIFVSPSIVVIQKGSLADKNVEIDLIKSIHISNPENFPLTKDSYLIKNILVNK